MIKSPHMKSGFTLIEISIVLVIIGLIVGGILVGRDLIAAATIRAQVSQIEKYQTATNTFRSKYGYLPGDIPDPTAQQYGFVARGTFAGEGDGDGYIEGLSSDAANTLCGGCNLGGETATYWVDLSAANLIDGGFIAAAPASFPAAVTGVGIDAYMPQAKLGGGNYVFVMANINNTTHKMIGGNYFAIAPVTQVAGNGTNASPGNATPTGFSVAAAYAIDTKIDDGFPQSGRALAGFTCCPGGSGYSWTEYNPVYPARSIAAAGFPAASNAAVAPAAYTCYDNNSTANTPRQYSVGQNSGSGLNCTLEIKFQ